MILQWFEQDLKIFWLKDYESRKHDLIPKFQAEAEGPQST